MRAAHSLLVLAFAVSAFVSPLAAEPKEAPKKLAHAGGRQ